MTGSIGISLKRSNDHLAEDEPLAKKFDSFHLDVKTLSVDASESVRHLQTAELVNQPLSPQGGNCDERLGCSNEMGEYSPEMGPDQNPHYFNANRILFEAHLQRVLRIHGHEYVQRYNLAWFKPPG